MCLWGEKENGEVIISYLASFLASKLSQDHIILLSIFVTLTLMVIVSTIASKQPQIPVV